MTLLTIRIHVGIFSGTALLAGLLGLFGASGHAAPYAVSFDGVNDYITFGAAPGLGGSNFTVECWFRREGAGVSVSTGSGGVTAIPLVTKGRGEADGNNKDMNYFLGIRASDNVLVADFEEGAGGASPGLNHPVAGVTPVAMGTWYHAAVSYNGTNLCLFLNGCLETNVVIGRWPRWDSIQHAAIGSAMTSSGAAAGFFKGKIDRVRIWKCPRSADQIMENMERDSLFAAGLAGCWSLDEGSGTVATDSSGNGINGTLLNGAAWVAGTPMLKTLGIAGFMPAAVTCPSLPSQGVDFGGANPNSRGNYFNIEEASHTSPTEQDGPTAYQLASFTLECWFRRDGRGVTNNTGGLLEAVPLISKGGGADQVDGVPAQDMNYFLGIALVNNQWVIGADFEDDAGGNHPITGVTPIENNVWYHAAATYDGNTWAIYLNGLLENAVTDTAWCQSGSLRRAAIGTARDATGTEGTRISYFNGAMDEVCIWDFARDQADISADMAGGIPAQAGLIGYWKLNGNRSDSSGAFGRNNTLTAGGTVPYATYNLSPFVPVPLSPESPANGATFVGISPGPDLQVQARDPEGNPMEVRFYGRSRYVAASPGAYSTYTPGPDFTIVAVPDTQYYVGAPEHGGTPAMFHRQIKWILDNRVASNIVYVAQLGDCAETPTTGEYDILSAGGTVNEPGFYDLETIAGLADGLPYGIAVGNHDQALNGDPLAGSTAFYNQYFGIPHFTPRSYFAGHFGRNGADGYSSGEEVNDNHFDLFSASGLDFVVVYLEFNDLAVPIPDTDPVQYTPNATEAALWEQTLTWADQVLKTYPNRRGIIVSHWIIEHGNPGAFSTPRCATCLSGGLSPGARAYDRLRVNPNLTLMLCGHRSEEGRRVDFYGGNKVHSMLSDYQGRAGGGNGWLRMLQFSPSNNVIRVWTYSPHLDPNINTAMPAGTRHFEDDADSQFVLEYDLQHTPFRELGSVQLPASPTAQTATLNDVTGLRNGIEYEWYAAVSDGCSTNFGPAWKFTTGRYPYYAWVQPQAPYGTAYGINNNGFSVGRSQQEGAPSIAVEWDNAEYSANIVTVLQDPFFTAVLGLGINDGRDLVGYGILASGGQIKAFVRVNALPEWDSLGTPPSAAFAINNAGVIAGFSTVNGLEQACKWGPFPNVATVVIGPLPSDSFSEARDINNRPVGQAQIVGRSIGPTWISRGFVYDEALGGPPVPLPPLDRNNQSRASGVNDNGVVVGESFTGVNADRAVRWNNVGSVYQIIELGPPAGSPPGTMTTASKISNGEVIVGTAYNEVWMSEIGNNSRAVVWFDNVGYYLDALTYPDYGYLHFNSAVGVTESGRILSIKLQGGEDSQAVIVWP